MIRFDEAARTSRRRTVFYVVGDDNCRPAGHTREGTAGSKPSAAFDLLVVAQLHTILLAFDENGNPATSRRSEPAKHH